MQSCGAWPGASACMRQVIMCIPSMCMPQDRSCMLLDETCMPQSRAGAESLRSDSMQALVSHVLSVPHPHVQIYKTDRARFEATAIEWTRCARGLWQGCRKAAFCWDIPTVLAWLGCSHITSRSVQCVKIHCILFSPRVFRADDSPHDARSAALQEVRHELRGAASQQQARGGLHPCTAGSINSSGISKSACTLQASCMWVPEWQFQPTPPLS